ncbi:uncharacterized protein LOC127103369 [Lathyrus oleraceus]|uniref:uncharacterized protein LOC127103369 n=1 Tax=Pisum sativum TaxID=3888 RepID=UPI0021D25EE1|nr:uncharacterized protein LOC127103369 [Pisum sativum]
MLTTLQALLKGTKHKLVKEQVNRTWKDETTVPQALPPKMKDPVKFTIACTIGGVNIPYSLCHLGSSINVMPLNKFTELKYGEIIPSNMTLTLAESTITHLIGIIQDMLVHVDCLVFIEDFVVIDMKGDSGESVILELPFLATRKALIDVETSELVLKFNNENMAFKVYEWKLYMDNLETCYQLEGKGSKDDKGKKESELIGVRVFLVPDMP